MIKFSKIRQSAEYPTKATTLSACWDLYAADNYTLIPGCTTVISTGLIVKMPDDYEMQIRSKSGLSIKGIVVANSPGTVDSDFTYKNDNDDPFDYEIKIILYNQSKNLYEIKTKDKIAQASFHKVDPIELIQIEDYKTINSDEYLIKNIKFCEIKDKKRNGGFGSTGI